MNVIKGTQCILSNLGHYNFYYLSDKVTEFNRDCVVEIKPYINTGNANFIAVQTYAKNIGCYETNSNDEELIIVWINKTNAP